MELEKYDTINVCVHIYCVLIMHNILDPKANLNITKLVFTFLDMHLNQMRVETPYSYRFFSQREINAINCYNCPMRISDF